MATQAVREKLKAKFPADKVKTRQGPGSTKLDYISGDTMVERLLEATADEETGYAWQAQIHTLEKLDKGWLAVVQGALLVQGDMGSGVGAMINPDPDMAVKSANTEALKNAAKNGFGCGLELWDAEYRATLAQRRNAISGSESAKKKLVFDLAKKKLGNNPKAAEVAELFGVTVGDLSEPATLDKILSDEGLL